MMEEKAYHSKTALLDGDAPGAAGCKNYIFYIISQQERK
jgi:hypothetical protein